MYERVPWNRLFPWLWRNWKVGQHVLVCGPTGCGKTTLLTEILRARGYVVFFGTKTHDDTYDTLRASGFERIDKWPPPRDRNKVMLWPEVKSGTPLPDIARIHRNVFGPALDKMFYQGNWTVVFDEQQWFCDELRLTQHVKTYHHQGRSSGFTCVDGFQRPAFIPRITYSSATHAFIWRTTDGEDIKRLSFLDGVTVKELTAAMNSLERHEFIYINTRQPMRPIISKVVRS